MFLVRLIPHCSYTVTRAAWFVVCVMSACIWGVCGCLVKNGCARGRCYGVMCDVIPCFVEFSARLCCRYVLTCDYVHKLIVKCQVSRMSCTSSYILHMGFSVCMHVLLVSLVIRGPIYKLSYDLSCDYLKFIVRSTMMVTYKVLTFLLWIS